MTRPLKEALLIMGYRVADLWNAGEDAAVFHVRVEIIPL